MPVSSEKVLWRIPPTNYSLHLSPTWLCFIKCSLESSANCALHSSPSLFLGSKLRELLTCLNHTNPVHRKRPIMSLLLGYSLGLFSWWARIIHGDVTRGDHIVDLHKFQPVNQLLEVVKLGAQRRATTSVCSTRLPVTRVVKAMFPWAAPDMTSIQRCPQNIMFGLIFLACHRHRQEHQPQSWDHQTPCRLPLLGMQWMWRLWLHHSKLPPCRLKLGHLDSSVENVGGHGCGSWRNWSWILRILENV